MQLHFTGELSIQPTQELQKLLVTMMRVTLTNNTAFQHLKRCE